MTDIEKRYEAYEKPGSGAWYIKDLIVGNDAVTDAFTDQASAEIVADKLNVEDESRIRLTDAGELPDEDIAKHDIDLVVWDLETSGFKAPDSKILEIGAFIIRGDSIEEKRWVLDNKIEIPEEITAINGMTNEIVSAEGIDPKKAIEEFMALLLLGKQHVTHNGFNFDMPFLVNTAKELLGYDDERATALHSELEAFAFDTAVWFKAKNMPLYRMDDEAYSVFAYRVMRERVPGLKFNLGVCCDDMGVDRTGIVQHRALADVKLTYELYKKIFTPTPKQTIGN